MFMFSLEVDSLLFISEKQNKLMDGSFKGEKNVFGCSYIRFDILSTSRYKT